MWRNSPSEKLSIWRNSPAIFWIGRAKERLAKRAASRRRQHREAGDRRKQPSGIAVDFRGEGRTRNCGEQLPAIEVERRARRIEDLAIRWSTVPCADNLPSKLARNALRMGVSWASLSAADLMIGNDEAITVPLLLTITAAPLRAISRPARNADNRFRLSDTMMTPWKRPCSLSCVETTAAGSKPLGSMSTMVQTGFRSSIAARYHLLPSET